MSRRSDKKAEKKVIKSAEQGVEQSVEQIAEQQSNLNFEQLIASIKECNAQLEISESHTLAIPVLESESDEAKLQAVEQVWQDTLNALELRAVYISQLSSLFNTLNQSQIDIVAQLYQSIIDNDAHSVNWAMLEQRETRNALRAIKNAEKALPMYKAHKAN